LELIERPSAPTVAQSGFEFCGYDILDSYDSVSVLTNCGGFPDIYEPGEVNRYGLIDGFERCSQIAAAIRDANPYQQHCFDCRIWSLCRYVDPA
jgi:hypothetical protein